MIVSQRVGAAAAAQVYLNSSCMQCADTRNCCRPAALLCGVRTLGPHTHRLASNGDSGDFIFFLERPEALVERVQTCIRRLGISRFLAEIGEAASAGFAARASPEAAKERQTAGKKELME